ncbi:RmlC-like cupin domain-containing protein [Xylaria palmicola]|nr:RmlC-like cupin domain-containing protein [Xylaria palmicola]
MTHRTLLAACVVALATLTLFPGPTRATQCGDDRQSTSQHTTTTSTSSGGHQPTAQEVVAELGLAPNVEGGYYVETFRDAALLPGGSNRSVSTAIYYLLEGPGLPSVWHRVDAAEVWHWYGGASLELQLSRDDGTPTRRHVLGPDLFRDQRPQVVIPAGDWQRAVSYGSWTLVGTTVSPAFVPEGYELAPDGWEPNGA